MTAEYLHWANRMGVAPEGKPYDSNWDYVFSSLCDDRNCGTNPHLKSTKYTGHGIVLRAGVGTPEELSIHLDQVTRDLTIAGEIRERETQEGSTSTLPGKSGPDMKTSPPETISRTIWTMSAISES